MGRRERSRRARPGGEARRRNERKYFMTKTTRQILAAVGGAIALMATSAARADVSDPAMTITASSSLGTGSFVVHLSDGTWDGDTWSWSSPRDAGWNYDIYDNDSAREIATVTRL